jgi:anti-sigma factor RsiW
MNAPVENHGCDQALLVQAEFDGELSASDALAANAHRRTCASCARTYALLSQSAAAMKLAPRFTAPPHLRAQLQERIAQRSTRAPQPRTTSRFAPWWGGAFIGAAAASLALFIVRLPSPTDSQALLDSHVRAMQAPNHLLDVESSEHHVVRPWFAGRLDFSPPAKDLATIGYPLKGARVDVIDGRTAAVLVYEAGRHTVDLFVWPDTRSVPGIRAEAHRGFNMRRWSTDGMTYWAVSDLSSHEMDAFVSHWQSAN